MRATNFGQNGVEFNLVGYSEVGAQLCHFADPAVGTDFGIGAGYVALSGRSVCDRFQWGLETLWACSVSNRVRESSCRSALRFVVEPWLQMVWDDACGICRRAQLKSARRSQWCGEKEQTAQTETTNEEEPWWVGCGPHCTFHSSDLGHHRPRKFTRLLTNYHKGQLGSALRCD